jgi:hypothetical protein
VAQAAALGYVTCQSTCGETATTHVFIQACVTRTGTGLTTAFSACDQTSFCNRGYRVCCPDGPSSPSITLLSADSPSCSAGCQSTGS